MRPVNPGGDNKLLGRNLFCLSLLRLPTAAGGANVVEGDGAAAEEDECEGKGSQSQGEFIPAIAHESVVEMNFEDGDGQVDADGKGGHPGKQADQNHQAADKFGEGGEVGAPGG